MVESGPAGRRRSGRVWTCEKAETTENWVGSRTRKGGDFRARIVAEKKVIANANGQSERDRNLKYFILEKANPNPYDGFD